MHPKDHKLKLYAVGSAEISQFCIPLPEGQKQKPSLVRKPLCISDIQQFDLIQDPEAEDVKVNHIPNPILKENIKQVVCGGVHTLLLTDKGQVYSFGSNDQGALGRKGEQTIPALVEIKQPVNMITAGDCHSMFADTQQNIIYFCGLYRGIVKGHIADKIVTPQQICLNQLTSSKKIKNLQKIVSGYNHSMILADQTVYIRGDSEYFALGRKILDRHKEKVKATTWMAIGLKKVQDIWTGGMHCFASVKSRNKEIQYYGWGNNSFGQLGLGRKGLQSIPARIDFFEDENIKNIVGGQHHSIFLTEEGQVYSCGKNDYGQLGLGQDVQLSDEQDAGINYVTTPRKVELQNVSYIASGPHFSYAITNQKQENKLYSWGFSSAYVLINGSQDKDKSEPYNVMDKILNFEKIIQIDAGGQHVMYLAEQNTSQKAKQPVPPVVPVVPVVQPVQSSTTQVVNKLNDAVQPTTQTPLRKTSTSSAKNSVKNKKS